MPYNSARSMGQRGQIIKKYAEDIPVLLCRAKHFTHICKRVKETSMEKLIQIFPW
jgi:hypothetical protein